MLTQGPRGTKDILPDTVDRWLYVEQKIRQLCQSFGYQEIRTPMFEHTELFQRGIGDTTDVVEKEMYSFTDRGGRNITLRPENTAAAVRSFLEHKLYAENALTKLFYIGSMFRYDRPQKGRYREFHQFGVEALGSSDPAVDAEVIILAMRFLESLGLKELTLSINSVGDPSCRPVYRERLREFFHDRLDCLCDDCRSRYERNPLRILDCKKESCHQLSEGVPEISECLCDDCRSHFEKVKAYLESAGIPYTCDPRLVRGLDYYTKTAFEIKYPPLGAQSAIAGGGRYDGLVEEIGGPSTPAVGFAAGLERVMLALETQGLYESAPRQSDVFVISLGEKAQIPAFSLLMSLRDAGLTALMDYSGRSLKAQMKQADKAGARFAAILGEDEIRDGTATLRNMQTSEQEVVDRQDIITKLCAEVKD